MTVAEGGNTWSSGIIDGRTVPDRPVRAFPDGRLPRHPPMARPGGRARGADRPRIRQPQGEPPRLRGGRPGGRDGRGGGRPARSWRDRRDAGRRGAGRRGRMPRRPGRSRPRAARHPRVVDGRHARAARRRPRPPGARRGGHLPRPPGALADRIGADWPRSLPLAPAVARDDGVARGYWHATGDEAVPWGATFALARRHRSAADAPALRAGRTPPQPPARPGGDRRDGRVPAAPYAQCRRHLAPCAALVAALDSEIVRCRACPRLVAWREEVARVKRRAFFGQEYWGRPVPGFGDPGAWLMIVGLAPAAHGANRTGRVFTGDRSGDCCSPRSTGPAWRTSRRPWLRRRPAPGRLPGRGRRALRPARQPADAGGARPLPAVPAPRAGSAARRRRPAGPGRRGLGRRAACARRLRGPWPAVRPRGARRRRRPTAWSAATTPASRTRSPAGSHRRCWTTSWASPRPSPDDRRTERSTGRRMEAEPGDADRDRVSPRGRRPLAPPDVSSAGGPPRPPRSGGPPPRAHRAPLARRS